MLFLKFDDYILCVFRLLFWLKLSRELACSEYILNELGHFGFTKSK